MRKLFFGFFGAFSARDFLVDFGSVAPDSKNNQGTFVDQADEEVTENEDTEEGKEVAADEGEGGQGDEESEDDVGDFKNTFNPKSFEIKESLEPSEKFVFLEVFFIANEEAVNQDAANNG